LDNYIKGYFAKYRLDEITSNVVEKFLVDLTEVRSASTHNYNISEDDDSGRAKKLKAKTINLVFLTFKMMMNEAVKQKLIKVSPCVGVYELKEADFDRDIFVVDEVRKLFPLKWQTVWENKMMYIINRLAACTGLRVGEIQGLRGEYVFDDYIYITGQFGRHGYVKHTKNKENRNVPLSAVMKEELKPYLSLNGNGYVFSDDGGKTPIPYTRIRDHFQRALIRIGISDEERKNRNLTFHSWRHFLNTLLRMSDVSDSKVQSVTGHRSMQMTNHYTHFDTRQFTEVRDVQTNLLTANGSGLKIAKGNKTPKTIKPKAANTAKQTSKTKNNGNKKKPTAKKTKKA